MDTPTSRRSSLSTSTIDLDAKSSLGHGDLFQLLYQSCHDVHERLVCLNYESQFCPEYKCKPIHR